MSSTRPHDPTRYRLLTSFAAGQWHDAAGEVAAFLGKREVIIHPGGDVRDVMLRWTSPIAGSVQIRGAVALVDRTCMADGSGITFFIDRGAEPLLTMDLRSGGVDTFALEAALARGESLYFIVDRGANNLCDSTLISLDIATVGAW